MAADIKLRKSSSLEEIDVVELSDLSRTGGNLERSSVYERSHRRNESSLSQDYLLPVRRHRAKSLEDIQIRAALRQHHVNHRGSVRGTFTRPTESTSFRWVWKKINEIGRDTRDYSLFVFHKNNVFRKRVKRVAKSRVFKFLMGLIVLLHSLALCFYLPAVNGDNRYQNDIIFYVTVLVTVLYIVEAGLNIVAYGLIQTSKGYLKNAAHVLDVFVIVFGILYIAMSQSFPILSEFFAALMSLKLIKIFALSTHVRFILKALAMSFVPLLNLSILTFIVITFFALTGIEILNGRLHGGCFANYITPAGNNKSVLVSAFPCDRDALNLNGSHTCPYGSKCLKWEEGPNRGVISFDNIGVAYLTVFQVISLEGWIQVLYLYESALGYNWVWLFFVTVVFFGSIFILNLWTGVLTSVFIGVSDREEEHGKIRRLNAKKLMEDDLQNYNDWLRIAAELDAPSDTGSIIDRRHSLFVFTDPYKEYSEDDDESDEESGNVGLEGAEIERRGGFLGRTGRELRSSRSKVRQMVKHKYFLWSVLVIRAINLILLMSLHFPSEQLFNTVVYAMNYLFSVLYLTEFLLGIYSLSKKKYLTYWRNVLHLLEITLAVLTVLELIVFVPVELLRNFHISVIINAVWCLKLMLFVKHTRSWGAMKEILRTVFQLLPSVLSLMLLVVVFLFVFTIAGLRLFGNRLSNTGHVEPNFDDFYFSFLLVFQLMTSEDWNSVLFTSLDHWIDLQGVVIGGLFAVYFVVAVGFGSFILLSVFLALSVDKLTEIRQLEANTAEQTERTEKRRNEKKQQIHDFHSTAEPRVRRRTIRRAMQFLSDNPEGRARQLQDSRKNWKQLSLPVEKLREARFHHRSTNDDGYSSRGVLRSTSAPAADVGSISQETDMEKDVFSSSSQERPKLRNPLRLMRKRSGFFEKQKLRLMGLPSNTESPSSTATHPAETLRSSSFETVHTKLHPKLSLDSAGEHLNNEKLESEHCSSLYERTQSCPADSPINGETEISPGFNMPKLDTIEEDEAVPSSQEGTEKQSNGNRSQLKRQDSIHTTPKIHRSFSPLNLALMDDHLTSAINRGGSLEEIHPFNTNHVDSRRGSQNVTTAKAKLKSQAIFVWKWIKDYVGNIQLNPVKELAEIPNHSSFFILAPHNRFRELCYQIVCSKSFQTITFVAVLLSSLLLTLEVPIGVDPSDQALCSLQRVMIYLDCFFVLYFLIEMFLKMTALGVILHRGSYLRGFFNFLDFIIAVTNVVPIVAFIAQQIPEDPNICIAYSYNDQLELWVRILRVLRVLRPLRAIRIGGLYLVVTGLVSSVKSMGSIFFMIVLVLIVFAISGVQFFRGQFWYCTDPMKTLENECTGSHLVYDYTFGGAAGIPGLSCPQVEDRQWLQRGLNFDNIGTAILTLFSMLTIEGWQNVMYGGINSNPTIDSMTSRGQVAGNILYRHSAIFFIIYMVIMALILVQLFTGFVIVTFQEVGVNPFRESKLDRNQRNCLYYAISTRPLRQYIPRYEFYRKFHQKMVPIVNHSITKAVVAVALIVNCILLALVSYGEENEERRKIVYYFNVLFTFFFLLEAAVKIIVLSPPTYFRSVGNVFECLIVIAALLEFIIQQSIPDKVMMYTHVASSFRVLRLLTFIPRVRLILWTVIQSLEIFPWVGYLLMIVFFIYTVIGMQVFGTIKRLPIDELTASTEITEYNNFANFAQALLVMIRMATGENWQDIMLSCVNERPCEKADAGLTCGNDFAYFFFPSFYFFSSIMILNLFVAIVIDNFDYIVRDKSILGAHQLDLFVKLWSIYDPQAEGKLPPKTVLKFLRECNPPVGWGKLCPELLAYKKMIKMNMPIVDGKVTFNATLLALVRTSLKIQCTGCSECSLKCNVDFKTKLRTLFPTIPHKKIDDILPNENDHTVGEEYGARLVQRVWRNHILRRRKMMELFQGPKRRVLKAGLRAVPDAGPDLLQRKSSDFDIDVDLRSMPMDRSSRPSYASSFDPDGIRSPANIFLFPVDVEMTYSPTQNSPRLSPAQLDRSETNSRALVNSSSHSPTLDDGNEQAGNDELDQDELETVDTVSELSFASAYSNPMGATGSTSQRTSGSMETTV